MISATVATSPCSFVWSTGSGQALGPVYLAAQVVHHSSNLMSMFKALSGSSDPRREVRSLSRIDGRDI